MKYKCVEKNPEFLVSEYGDIYDTAKGTFVTGIIINSGYRQVSIRSGGTVLVHALVAYAFVKGYREGLEVDHIDGDKLNNYYKNLRWVTKKENINHNKELGVLNTHTARETLAKTQVKGVLQLDIGTGKAIGAFKSMKDAEKQTGVPRGKISLVCAGKRKSSGGYKWEYSNKGDINTQKTTSVLVTNEKGEQRTFSSVSKACSAFGVHRSCITYRKKKFGMVFTFLGYTWKLL